MPVAKSPEAAFGAKCIVSLRRPRQAAIPCVDGQLELERPAAEEEDGPERPQTSRPQQRRHYTSRCAAARGVCRGAYIGATCGPRRVGCPLQ